MGSWTNPGVPHLLRLHPWNNEAIDGYQAGTITALASAAFPTANASILWPFRIRRITQVAKLFVSIGGANTGNVDLGIYDSQCKALIASIGSTAAGTQTTEQVVTLVKTLWPGDYFFAVAASLTTIAMIASANGANALRSANVMKATANFPLAANPTLAGASDAFLPMGGLIFSPRTD